MEKDKRRIEGYFGDGRAMDELVKKWYTRNRMKEQRGMNYLIYVLSTAKGR